MKTMHINLAVKNMLKICAIVVSMLTALGGLGTSKAFASGKSFGKHHCHNNNHDHTLFPGLIFVDYRHLEGGKDGVALINMDPESWLFGYIFQHRSIGKGVLPHHLYFNEEENRLYTTALGGEFLYEIILGEGLFGIPFIKKIVPVDVGDNIVGEDIYFTEDGSRYYVTFMGGHGGDRDGSIGVFDAATNQMIDEIIAPAPDEFSLEEPFILYPHGISANEELGLLMVTSTIHWDLSTGVGNTVTLIDMNTNEPIQTYLVSDSPDALSSPVEVLMLRDELPPFALVTTMLGGDVWIAGYNEGTGLFDEFSKAVVGSDSGLSWPLEFYIHVDHEGVPELYVSFASPGVVNVYGLDQLPALPLKRTLNTGGSGAHHMTFFETASGREVIAVQNNLLNLDGLNSGIIAVLDIKTGEMLGELNLPEQYGLMPESIESAFGHGHDYHH